ncbi:hypothetical protein [Pseudomonas sp. NPDC089396]|uniref:hypothetical protein n=1 Tax=Pseudomonas sp. NPDC089396 TaxID=3364461 RepID=UPI0038335592
MTGFDARWLGIPLVVAIFVVIFLWIFVSVRYVSRIELLLSRSSMVSGNKKIFVSAGLLGKVMRTGSASVLLSMKTLCVRKGLLHHEDVNNFPVPLRHMLVGLWFAHVLVFSSLIGLWVWLKFAGY